jgi:hypothetical protein
MTRDQRRPKQEKEITLMKTKLVRNIMAPLLFACALATLVAAERVPRDGTQGGRIQGVWEQQTSVTDCAGHVIRSFRVMLTFHQGGTMMDGPSTPPALRTPAQGVWRHTADHNYAFRLKTFTFDAQNVFTGWTIIAGELTVDATGDANSGPATVEVYDPNGNLLVSLCAETVGTRFEL